MKKFVKAYFSFSRKEKKAIILLLMLIGCFLAAPEFFPESKQKQVSAPELEAYVRAAESIANVNHRSTGFAEKELTGKLAKDKPVYFYFDPNSIPDTDWRKLGIAEKTIQTILHYRQKGGRFRSAEDIRKIWGIPKETADHLIPFISIRSDSASFNHAQKGSYTKPFIHKTPSQAIDINTASAEDWESLPGIGEVLAKRILAFRKRLGGFNSLEQVGRTYGLKDSVFRRILPLLRVENNLPARLNLNTVTAIELEQITGITRAQANAIIAYRKQYGFFQQIDDLKKIIFIRDTVFQQLKPFLYLPEKQ
jgi:competence protein ComEA